jgi:hypothetical protein
VFGRRLKAQALKAQRRGEDTEVPEGVSERVNERLGPYDVAEAPDDGRLRLDLGSLRLPVPQGAQLQVEVDRSGPVRAVHLMTELGQVTITAFAAPRSGGLWREVCRELVIRLRADGARVGRAAGEWGEEIEAVTAQGVLRFLAVDGPRWMLRGVAVGSAEHADARTALLRDVVREAVVVRGPEPLPVRSPLPLQLPGSLAEQLKQAAAEQDTAITGGD